MQSSTPFSDVVSMLAFQESPSPRPNGDHSAADSSRGRDSVGLNGDKPGSSKPASQERPLSRSGSSSSRSTPNLKTRDVSLSFTVQDNKC